MRPTELVLPLSKRPLAVTLEFLHGNFTEVRARGEPQRAVRGAVEEVEVVVGGLDDDEVGRRSVVLRLGTRRRKTLKGSGGNIKTYGRQGCGGNTDE